MSFEVLFLGLVMMCTDAEMCDFTAGEYGARAVLPNATVSGLNCNNGGCKGCDQTGMRHPHHYPSILFLANQAEGEDASICIGNLCHIKLAGEYSFKVENATGPLSEKLPTVPDIHHFEDRLTALHTDVYTNAKRAIAWIDLADTGTLSTKLVSSSSWEAHPPKSTGNPQFGNLAEAIHWQASQGTLVLKTSNGSIRFNSGARVAVVNAPDWDRVRGGGSPRLDHYQLFYRLLDGNLRAKEECRRPKFAGVGTHDIIAYDVARWVRIGQLEGVRAAEEPDEFQWVEELNRIRGISHITSDAALCPPSKFP